MIIVPTLVLRDLMTKIAGITHQLVTPNGDPVMINTIPEAQLRQAALVAIQIATGEALWPGDRKITIVRRKQTDDIFEEV